VNEVPQPRIRHGLGKHQGQSHRCRAPDIGLPEEAGRVGRNVVCDVAQGLLEGCSHIIRDAIDQSSE
jgi:hypothetical protein